MRSTRLLAVLTLLAACQVDEPEPPNQGGQSGTAIPDGCYEVSREPVADVSTVADGFDHAPEDAMADLVGLWEGSGTLGGQAVDVTFDVAWDGGLIEAVRLEWHESEVGADPAMGAPEGPATSPEDCDPYYAFGLATSLSAPPLLEADGLGTLFQTMGGARYFVAETDVDDVGGTLEPGFDPAEWDRATLAAGFEQAFDGTVSLSLNWWGQNDTRAATGTASGTGTVGVAGITEPIGTISPLVRRAE